MGKIIILDEHTANKIAAGEVVERPASIVKELCENSIDAGAAAITVEIKNGGISLIKVVDNGSGISKDDVEIAFEKHSTSKIRNADDLNSIATMGFRGEALASIASVSRVELITRMAEDLEGSKIKVDGGNVGEREEVGCPVGTGISVRDLFFNTPARYKFLKKDYTEAGYVEDVVTRLALGYPNISFKFVNSGSIAIHTPGSNELLACAYSIFGSTAKAAVKVKYDESSIEVEGLAGKPEIARSNRSQQIFFINNRYVKNKTITSAVEEAYKTLIPAAKFPFIILNIKLDPQLVDVNVHPTKQEVRFSDESLIFRAVYHALKNTLFGGTNLVPEFDSKVQSSSNTGSFRMDVKESGKNTYEQKEMTGIFNNKFKSTIVPCLEQSVSGNNYNGFSEPKLQYKVSDVKESQVAGQVTDYAPTKDLSKDSEEDAGRRIDFKVIGTAFATYIIVEVGDEIYIIDQHAAHERVIYEKLKKEWDKGKQLAQMLLIPEVIELTHKEISLIEENMEMLSEVGFSIEQFGNNTVKISAIPLFLNKSDAKEIFLGTIDGLVDLSRVREKKAEESILFMVACKAAVKANYSLRQEEISALLSSMMNLENPYTCPHGRPTAIRMTRYELEKKFGRT